MFRMKYPKQIVIQTTEGRKDLVNTHFDVFEILRFALNDNLCWLGIESPILNLSQVLFNIFVLQLIVHQVAGEILVVRSHIDEAVT